MARTLGLMTELELVNSVLSVAGDNPVQSLDEDYQPVFVIRQMLNNISRDMQSDGYWFNTEHDVSLTPNTLTNEITLPFNILKFEPTDVRYVQRGSTVYDREDRTNTITKDITADVTVQLSFDELPQSARKFIQAHCRQQYNNEYFGGTAFKQEIAREVQQAEIALEKEHIENENINILSASRVSNIAFKNRRRS